MCFSAPVSFVSSAGLAGASGSMLRSYKQIVKRKKFLVFIPLLFAVQQLIEGFQWIVPRDSVWSGILGYGFLVFAFVIWPFLTPLVVLILETDLKRKAAMWWFFAGGVAVSTYLLVMMSINSLAVKLDSLHVVYDIDFPFSREAALAYVFVVCGSLLYSTDKQVRYFGYAAWVLSAIAWVLFQTAFISTWCLFSALLTSLIYVYVQKK